MNIKLRFFSPKKKEAESETKEKEIKGFINQKGTIVLPLDVNFGESKYAKIATSKDSKTITSLYIAPTADTNQFKVRENKSNYTINVADILTEDGFDYSSKVPFTIKPFTYRKQNMYELEFGEPAKPYTGKPRGRKKTETTE